MPHRKIASINLAQKLTGNLTWSVVASVTNSLGNKAEAVMPSNLQERDVVSLKKLEEKINKVLRRQDISDQNKIDIILKKLVLKNSPLYKASIMAISVAVARLNAKVSGRSLYEYMRDDCLLAGYAWRLPTLVTTLLEDNNKRLLALVSSRALKNNRAENLVELVGNIHIALNNSSESLRQNGHGNFGGHKLNTVMNEAAWKLVLKVFEKKKLKLGKDVWLGFDLDGEQIYDKFSKRYKLDDGAKVSVVDMINWAKEVGRKFEIHMFIDPLSSQDKKHWGKFASEINKSQLTVFSRSLNGDTKELHKLHHSGNIECVGVKLENFSTLTDLLHYLSAARHSDLPRLLSVGALETEDDFIVDIAFASRVEFLDIGGPIGMEHVTKYNRLLTIGDLENL